MKVLREFIFTLLIAAVIFLALQISIKSFEVFNVSMLPTFREGDLIIVNKLSYAFGNQPRQKDEIVFYEPGNEPKPAFDPFFTQHPSCFIKRVIAVPGDTVEIRDKAVFVNGNKLVEPYIREAPNYYMPMRDVPAGQYFVLGDNRNHSNDSHTGWLVPANDIIGKVWFRYWTADYPNIRLVMIPVFILIVGTLIIVMIVDASRSNRS
ncbi:MAG: signal peptidase I [Dehalococcoidia bacterium]|nr:signal peptidase I [Dehalococcoidia bacterium]